MGRAQVGMPEEPACNLRDWRARRCSRSCFAVRHIAWRGGEAGGCGFPPPGSPRGGPPFGGAPFSARIVARGARMDDGRGSVLAQKPLGLQRPDQRGGLAGGPYLHREIGLVLVGPFDGHSIP